MTPEGCAARRKSEARRSHVEKGVEPEPAEVVVRVRRGCRPFYIMDRHSPMRQPRDRPLDHRTVGGGAVRLILRARSRWDRANGCHRPVAGRPSSKGRYLPPGHPGQHSIGHAGLSIAFCQSPSGRPFPSDDRRQTEIPGRDMFGQSAFTRRTGSVRGWIGRLPESGRVGRRKNSVGSTRGWSPASR